MVLGLNLIVFIVGGVLDVGMNISICGVGMIGDGFSFFFLIFIDGMEGDMNSINFNDIENIFVLKDVVVFFIYGLCVLFGVILIIIKSGKVGCISVNYSINVCFKFFMLMLEMMDLWSFVNYWNEVGIN